MGQSSLGMKLFRLRQFKFRMLRHFGIKSVDPGSISRAVLVAVGIVPWPISYHKRARAGSGPAQEMCSDCWAGICEQSIAALLWQKHNLRIALKTAATSGTPKREEITQKKQFGKKTHIVDQWPDCFLCEEQAGAANCEVYELLAEPKQYWE